MIRLARSLALLAALLAINFALPRMLPGDPVAYLQSGGLDAPVSLAPDARAQLLVQQRRDDPPYG